MMQIRTGHCSHPLSESTLLTAATAGSAWEADCPCNGVNMIVLDEILKSSRLQPFILQHIRSTVTRNFSMQFSTPFQVILSLGLVGLAQNSTAPLESLSLQSLYNCPKPPNPYFSYPFPLTKSISSFHSSLERQSLDFVSAGHSSSKTQDMSPLVGIGSPVNESQSSMEEEWADFTSFTAPEAVDLVPLSCLLPVNEPIRPVNSNSIPVNQMPPLRDDDFGEFQVGAFPPPIKTSESQPESLAMSVAKPSQTRYTLSSDLLSGLTSTQVLQQEWVRCINECTKIASSTLQCLESLTSEEDRQQFCECEKGFQFLLDFFELFSVAQRIRLSANKYDASGRELQQCFKSLYVNISHLLDYVKCQLKTDFDRLMDLSSCRVTLDDVTGSLKSPPSPTNLCGVCLFSTLDDEASFRGQFGTKQIGIIELAGRSYHAPCANFWVNRIQLGLPALEPP